MITVKYCRAPSHNWIGWGWHETGFYYSAGTTLDNLIQRFKANVYHQKRISGSQVILDTKPTDLEHVPMAQMKQMFLTKYYFGKDGERLVKDSVPSPIELGVAPAKQYAYYEKEIVDGMLYVYGIERTLVAAYNMEPSVKATITKE